MDTLYPADQPKTDRELLLLIHEDTKHLKNRVEGRDGKGGICGELVAQSARIGSLENWRWYIIGGASVLLFIWTAVCQTKQ